MDAGVLLRTLRQLSNQAAHIASVIRDDVDLFELLVASKGNRDDGEPDFKTLADVLIQSVFRAALNRKFPVGYVNVYGEEDGTFPVGSGKVTIEINDDPDHTRDTLRKILSANHIVEKLTRLIHENVAEEVSGSEGEVDECQGIALPHPLDIWIDPIDATKSYIQGEPSLDCVTVLVGVHYQGQPILGVMTYPFIKCQVWGLCYDGRSLNNLPKPSPDKKRHVVMSTRSDFDGTVKVFGELGYSVSAPSGAGNKLGHVIRGLAVAYYCPLASTFQWDTCGPHAILRSLGGDIVTFDKTPLSYDHSMGPNPAFIAYMTEAHLDSILKIAKG